MMGIHRNPMVILSVVLVGVTVGACAIQRAQEASEAKASMVGMSREQVLSCMGSPVNAAKAGATEVWTYNSGNGRTDTFGTATAFRGSWSATAFGSSTTTSRYCKVDIVMNGGLVSRVNYTGPTGGLLTEGEQCAFAVDNCARDAALTRSAAASNPSAPQLRASTEAATVEPTSAPAHPSAKDEAEIKQLAHDSGYQYQSGPMTPPDNNTAGQ